VHGFVDTAGEIVLAATLGDALDKDAKVVLATFLDADAFGAGLAPVKVDRRGYGYIDRAGALRIQPQFTQAACFDSGRAPVEVEIDG
jgi:hypothetical protein